TGGDRHVSFSKSLPATPSERMRSPSAHTTPHTSYPERSEYFPAVHDHDHSEEASPASEDEESEREQISSALYIPHRQVSPENQAGANEQGNYDEIINKQQTATATTGLPVESGDSSGEKSLEGVEISLQSQDDVECLHGNLPHPTPLPTK